MTLIEIMVTMAIVGVILAVTMTGLRSAFNVNLKSAAGKMAATLRYMSNKAVTDHLYLRMVYDLDKGEYRVEESQDPFLIDPAPPKPKEKRSSKKEDSENPEENPGGDEEGGEGENANGSFVAATSTLLEPFKLPSGVLFKDVTVSYLKGRMTQGEVATYFFPDGFSTPTVINLKNEDDNDASDSEDSNGECFSVEVFPLSGRVKVMGAYKEALTEETRPNE